MKQKLFALIIIVTLFVGCLPRTNPNEYVIVTRDCWNTLSVIKAGEIPPRLLTACDRKIILPAYSMDGNTNISVRFQGEVKGRVTIDYQYTIENPVDFIGSAKFIVSSDTDGDYKADLPAIEQAENGVIDKIAKDVTREYTQNTNPVNIDESKMESELIPLINAKLISRGVLIGIASIDIDFREQTEQALDVISASNLYKSADLENLGNQVIINQASKPVININRDNYLHNEAKEE